MLKLSMLGRRHSEIFFSKKIGFDISCKLSQEKKEKKKNINLSSAESA